MNQNCTDLLLCFTFRESASLVIGHILADHMDMHISHLFINNLYLWGVIELRTNFLKKKSILQILTLAIPVS